MFKKVMLLIIVSFFYPLSAADQRPIITQLCTALATENNQKVRELFFQLPSEYLNTAHPDNKKVMNTLHDNRNGENYRNLLMHAFYTTNPHAEANMDFLRTRGATICDGYRERVFRIDPINDIIKLFAINLNGAHLKNTKMMHDSQNALKARIDYAVTQLSAHPIIQPYQNGPIHTALDTNVPMPSIVRCLIQHKADPNATKNHNSTPLARVVELIDRLHHARSFQRPEWLETLYVLIEGGADPLEGVRLQSFYGRQITYGLWERYIGDWTDGVDIWHEAIARQKKQGESSLEKQCGENPEWLITRCAKANRAQQAKERAEQEQREKEAVERQVAAEKARQDALRIAQEEAAHAEAVKRAEESSALYQILKCAIERQNLTEIQNALTQGANPKIPALDNLGEANNLLEYAEQLYKKPDEIAAPSSRCCGSQEAQQRQISIRRTRLAETKGEILQMLETHATRNNVEAHIILDISDSKHA